LEDEPHAIATAFTVTHAQCAGQPLGLRPRVPGADQTSPDLGGRAPARSRIQRVAAEKIDLLQLRKQSGTRIAARDALHLGNGEEFARLAPTRQEVVPADAVAGDDEDITSDSLAARRLQP